MAQAQAKPGGPEWAEQIRALRLQRALSQAAFARELGVSAMAVSRWERGVQEPPGEMYVRVGNLAGPPLCWYFWGRAGLHAETLRRALPESKQPSSATLLSRLAVVPTAGMDDQPLQQKSVVAVPVLPLEALTAANRPPDFHGAHIEELFAVPRSWCPHPDYMISFRVRGTAMAPLIQDGALVAIDTYDNNRGNVTGRIVVAAHKEYGLKVAWLRRFQNTEVLVPENRDDPETPISGNPDWWIVGQVTWWVTTAPTR